MMISFEILSLVLLFHLIIPFGSWIETGTRSSFENNYFWNGLNDRQYKQNSDDKEIKISKLIIIVTNLNRHLDCLTLLLVSLSYVSFIIIARVFQSDDDIQFSDGSNPRNSSLLTLKDTKRNFRQQSNRLSGMKIYSPNPTYRM